MSVNDGENLKAYYDDQVVKGETKMDLLAGCKVIVPMSILVPISVIGTWICMCQEADIH